MTVDPARRLLPILSGVLLLLAWCSGAADAQPLPPFRAEILRSLPPEPAVISPVPAQPPPGLPALPAPPPQLPPGAVPGAGPVDPPAPHVTIQARVAASAVPGRELTYRLIVQNHSRGPAHHVLVRCPVPSHSRFVRAEPEPTETEPELRWRLGTLAGCQAREIVLAVVPTGEGDLQTCARVQIEYGQCVRTSVGSLGRPPGLPPGLPPELPPEGPPERPPDRPAEQPRVQLRVSGPSQALQYDVVTFRLEATNTGRVPAREVAVSATLPPALDYSTSTPSPTSDTPLTWSLGTLEPGQSRRIDCQVIAKQTGEQTFTAELRDASGLRDQGQARVTVGEASLTIVKTGPARRLLNSPATYMITVANTGTMPASNVVIVDVIPAQLTFISATDGGLLADREVRWRIGAVAPGARRTVQLTLRAREPGELINRATVRADRGLSAQAEARTIFEGASGLTLEIDKSDDPIEVGKNMTYTVRIVNQGTGPATKLALTVTVPAEMKVVGQKGATAGQAQGQQVTFAPLDTLPPGGESRFQVEVQALRPAEVRLRAELAAEQLTSGPLRAEESTTIYADRPPGGP